MTILASGTQSSGEAKIEMSLKMNLRFGNGKMLGYVATAVTFGCDFET